ncbi:MAG: hypothetical protein AAF449_24075, partial [Myxococcota bacterium]
MISASWHDASSVRAMLQANPPKSAQQRASRLQASSSPHAVVLKAASAATIEIFHFIEDQDYRSYRRNAAAYFLAAFGRSLIWTRRAAPALYRL